MNVTYLMLCNCCVVVVVAVVVVVVDVVNVVKIVKAVNVFFADKFVTVCVAIVVN
jgi:hypothetical protein